jgi:hypothetical protein
MITYFLSDVLNNKKKYLNKVTHPVETSVEMLAFSLLAISHYLNVPLSIDQMIENSSPCYMVNNKAHNVILHEGHPQQSPLKIVVTHKLANNDDVSNEYEIPPHTDFALTTTTDLINGKSTTILSVSQPEQIDEKDTLALSPFS